MPAGSGGFITVALPRASGLNTPAGNGRALRRNQPQLVGFLRRQGRHVIRHKKQAAAVPQIECLALRLRRSLHRNQCDVLGFRRDDRRAQSCADRPSSRVLCAACALADARLCFNAEFSFHSDAANTMTAAVAAQPRKPHHERRCGWALAFAPFGESVGSYPLPRHRAVVCRARNGGFGPSADSDKQGAIAAQAAPARDGTSCTVARCFSRFARSSPSSGVQGVAARDPRRIVRVRSYFAIQGAPSSSLLLRRAGLTPPSTLKRLPQSRETAANSGLDRTQRLARLGRDFRMCVMPFEVGHLQRAALRRRHRRPARPRTFSMPPAHAPPRPP